MVLAPLCEKDEEEVGSSEQKIAMITKKREKEKKIGARGNRWVGIEVNISVYLFPYFSPIPLGIHAFITHATCLILIPLRFLLLFSSSSVNSCVHHTCNDLILIPVRFLSYITKF